MLKPEGFCHQEFTLLDNKQRHFRICLWHISPSYEGPNYVQLQHPTKTTVYIFVIQSCPTLYAATCKAPLSKEFSRQEYWSGLPFPSPGDLHNPGIEPTSSYRWILYYLSHQGSPKPRDTKVGGKKAAFYTSLFYRPT